MEWCLYQLALPECKCHNTTDIFVSFQWCSAGAERQEAKAQPESHHPEAAGGGAKSQAGCQWPCRHHTGYEQTGSEKNEQVEWI